VSELVASETLPQSPSEGSRLPCDQGEQFDTVLLVAVLHHATNPRDLLRLAWAATRQRLIIIESVIGVRERHHNAEYDLVDSSLEDQIGYAVFIDWFYNRVLHDDVQVPYNFTTPERWKEVFDDEKMDLKQIQFLGQDIKIGPEYHVLFVLEKAAAGQETPVREAAMVGHS
jgi:SAM-dependent methyltransferase